MAPLDRLPDLELLARFQAGSNDALDALDALLDRYRRFARAKARTFFLVGADRDDVEQEALIGLFKAARDFRPDHDASFRSFAELCITRQILTAIKAANRQKHQALNQSVPFAVEHADEGGERSLEEVLVVREDDPAVALVEAERFGLLRRRLLDVLSTFEVDVLRLYAEGRTYQEIGEHLDRHAKSVDNAVQRIKRKVELHLVERATAEEHEDLALIA